jgi:hypothetical protein
MQKKAEARMTKWYQVQMYSRGAYGKKTHLGFDWNSTEGRDILGHRNIVGRAILMMLNLSINYRALVLV